MMLSSSSQMKKAFIIACIIVFLIFILGIDATQEPTQEEIERHAQESVDFFQARALAIQSQSESNGPSKGLDYSTSISIETHKCFIKNGWGGFVIPRGYKSTGFVDNLLVSNVANAWASGFPAVDAYFFPMVKSSKTATQQLAEFWQHITSHKIKIGLVWLDIESSSTAGTHAENDKYFREWISAATKSGIRYGLYSSSYMWSTMFGSKDHTLQVTTANIWFARYTLDPGALCNFSQVSFGGFKKAAIHQYQGDKVLCGAGVDYNQIC